MDLLSPDIAGGLRRIGRLIGAKRWLFSHVVARLFLFWQRAGELHVENVAR